MINKCVKLLLILVFVVAVAIGVSMLPFSLSDKFKKVVETVTSSIKGLTGLDFGGSDKVVVDFSQTDNYTHGDFNVALDRVENVPKEGFFKFVHKGEKDAPLDVEKFMNGDVALEGLEGGMFDYCAGYFKGEHPYLLMVELDPHEEDEENAEGEGENKPKAPKAEATPTPKVKKNPKLFYVPGDTNWVKLPEGADLGAKVEEVFGLLSAKAALAGTPGAPAPGEGGLRAPGVGPAPEGESGASGHGVPGPGLDAEGRPEVPGPRPAVPVGGPGERAPGDGGNVAPREDAGVTGPLGPPGGLGGGANLRTVGTGDVNAGATGVRGAGPEPLQPASPELGSRGGNSNDNHNGGPGHDGLNQNNPQSNPGERGAVGERGVSGPDGEPGKNGLGVGGGAKEPEVPGNSDNGDGVVRLSADRGNDGGRTDHAVGTGVGPQA